MVLYSTVGCSVLFAKTSDFVIATWSNVTVALLLNAGIQCHMQCKLSEDFNKDNKK